MDPIMSLSRVPRYYSWHNLLQLALVAAYLLLALTGLNNYIHWDAANFLVGLGTLPLTLGLATKTKSMRFGWLALVFAFTGLFLPVKTALYMALSCALLFVYGSNKGRTTVLSFLTLFLMSPVCGYFAEVFSFPVRLWLTDVAGSLLQAAGMKVHAAGNIISGEGAEFSVDPACMGLNMLVTSLLCGIILLAFYQRKYGLRLGCGWVLAGLCALLLLNIAANLCRIVVLVRFRLMPDNPLHGICGMICMIVYVLLPAAWLCRLLVQKAGRSQPEPGGAVPAGRWAGRIHLLLLPLLLFTILRQLQDKPVSPRETLPVVAGYTVSRYNDEVIKMESRKALVYLKPLKGAVYTDHNPLLCWNGSGYTFGQVETCSWSGISLFTGVLHKADERLYTAWWYENGSISTVSQWAWRWQTLKGAAPFTLINVTAADKATLQAEVARMAGYKELITRR